MLPAAVRQHGSGLNKNLGTRHRAGVGISEVTDSFTIIVSEETGNVVCFRRRTPHGGNTDLQEQQNPEAREKPKRRKDGISVECVRKWRNEKKILKKLLNNLPLKILSI